MRYGAKLKRRGIADNSPDLLQRLLSHRHVDPAAAETDAYALTGLLPPDLLALPHAADLVVQHLREHRILVIGDFDADGATSSALLVAGLRSMGGHHVDFLVPDRFRFGYGLTPEIVEEAQRSSPDLIITVDNGIASLEGAARAKELSIQLVVTDHHLAGETLPDADAIVNPNQPGCPFASKSIAGVGVAFYLLAAVRAVLRGRGEKNLPSLARFLDLVALGTVADVVPLDANNRIMVQQGLLRIRAGLGRPGIVALAEVAGAEIDQLTTRDLSFGMAPRLNAAGRIEDMSIGIACLLAEDLAQAREVAAKLDTLNKERRQIEREMREDANLQLADTTSEAMGICMSDPSWHQGVVGIIASRIKDRLHRPVIAFAPGSATELKGSARSIHGMHIRDALASIDVRHPGMIEQFGGHAMAAGLTLKNEHFDAFAEAFDDEAHRWLTEEDLTDDLLSDGEAADLLHIGQVRRVLTSAPWGQAFPEPLFDDVFEIINQRIVGGAHLRLRLRTDRGRVFNAIAFGHTDLLSGLQHRMAYRPEINRYRGLESVQLIIEALDLPLDLDDAYVVNMTTPVHTAR